MNMKMNLLGILYNKEVKEVEIKRITLGGYRNVGKIELAFGNITALVGLNGYGKSNVMDAIDFGFDFLHYQNPAKTALMSSKQNIPLLKSNAGQNFEFEVEAKLTSQGKEYFAIYEYSFAWKTEMHIEKILHERLRIRKDEKNQKYNTFILRNDSIAYYRSSISGRCDKKIKIEDNGLIINKLLALDGLFYIDIVKQINDIQFYIEKHLDASQSFMPAPFTIKGFQELELQGINSIPRAIFFLKKDYPDKYELLINAFMQLFPDIININVQEIKLNGHFQDNAVEFSEDSPIIFSDSIYTMSILDKKMIQPVRFEHLSDGTKRVFLMLAFAVIADIKSLSMIAIEEPENSIHPSLLQSYLDVLCQLVQDCKIIVTSHSPYVIQYLEPYNIYIGITNRTGEADFKRIAPTKVNSLYRDAAEYDRSVGDYIFNLISSSDSDEYIKEYLEIGD